MKKIKLILSSAAIAIFASVFFLSSGIKAQSIIISDSILLDVKYLSSSELAGRLPGTQGYDLASEYCESIFKNYDVQSFDSLNGYKQFVPVEKNRIIGPCDFAVIVPDKGKQRLKHGENYNFRGFTGSGQKELDVVFCGFGISQSDYDDYANVDVKGKAVVIFKGDARIDSINTEAFTIRSRVQNAVNHGAEAVIFIPFPDAQRNKPIGSTMCGEGEQQINIPQIQTDSVTAALLFEKSGLNLADCYNSIKTTAKPCSAVLKTKIAVNVEAVYVPEIKSYNTIGFIEGSDPKLKDEYILLTAHIDHVGSQCQVIYPGANDNASGCGAVLEYVRLFSVNKPERSIIFALLTAEESGLKGSEFLAANLPVDKDKIVAVFNFDCIASGDSIQIGNGKSSPELFNIAKKNDKEKLMLTDTWSGGGADLTAFHNIGLQGLYFVTRYSYTHLHLPTDTYENINPDIYKSIVKLGYLTIREVASDKFTKPKQNQ
jgi:hypothetical protein